MAGRVITIEPYDPCWADNFQQQAVCLQAALDVELVAIHHIGSTAVPGLAAKPVIDILLEVNDLSVLDERSGALNALGYLARGENGMAGRRYFTKGDDQRTHHLHAFVTGSEHIIRHLAFRDYLRSNAAVMAQYARLKYAAAEACANDSAAYGQLKNDFIVVHQQRAIQAMIYKEMILPHSPSQLTLAYETEGSGPLVILLHGLLLSGHHWQESGLVHALSKDYCVVCPDLPAHGSSPVFSNTDAYTLENMSRAIIQLIDQLGYERAHIIGYSAGAWLTTGLLQHYPHRLASAVIGGWDIVNGLPEGLDFATFMAFARSTAPELTASVTAGKEAGLQYFFQALSQKQSMADVVSNTTTPVLFWAGKQDPYYAPIEQWCNTNNLPLLTGSRDHLSTCQHTDTATTKALHRFIAQADQTLK